MIVFLDTNILLDVLLEREPFSETASLIWNMAEEARIKAFISAISFNNVYYVIRKLSGRKRAEDVLDIMRGLFHVVTVDRALVSDAIDAGFDDFEDAIQYGCAKRCRTGIIITRNPGHFPAGEIKIMNSDQFIRSRS